MSHDLVVVGGGSAGLTAAIFGARLGAKVLLVERDRLGGDCLWTGCVPSKALLSAAHAVAAATRARALGIDVETKVDFSKVQAHVASVQAQIAHHDSEAALAAHGVEVAFGAARLGEREPAHRRERGVVHVGERQVRCRHVILATGATPVHPPIEGLQGVGPLDHSSVWALRQLPARLLVLGAGPIGCELGQAFARLGSEVVLLEQAPRILPGLHADAAGFVERALRDDGITIHTGARAERFTGSRGRAHLRARTHDGAPLEQTFDAVLIATGRRPALGGLDLERAGVKREGHAIWVDDTLRTSRPDVYAIGDCAGAPQSTHWAEHEARVATRNALYLGRERVDRTMAPKVLFTDPEVAELGATDGRSYEVPFSRIDRAIVERETDGLCRVHVDAAGRVRGALLVGAHAAELAAEVSVAISQRLQLRELGDAIHPYPTRSRILRRVADEVFLEGGPPAWSRLFARFVPRRSLGPPRVGASKRVARNALLTSLVVGTALNLVNQGSALASLFGPQAIPVRWGLVALNFLVPLLVSLLSGWLATGPQSADQASSRSSSQ